MRIRLHPRTLAYIRAVRRIELSIRGHQVKVRVSRFPSSCLEVEMLGYAFFGYEISTGGRPPVEIDFGSVDLRPDKPAARLLQAVAARLARLVDAEQPAPANRAKGTDQVAPATVQADGALHGGDGASGEVPDSPPTGGPGAAEDQPADTPDIAGARPRPSHDGATVVPQEIDGTRDAGGEGIPLGQSEGSARGESASPTPGDDHDAPSADSAADGEGTSGSEPHSESHSEAPGESSSLPSAGGTPEEVPVRAMQVTRSILRSAGAASWVGRRTTESQGSLSDAAPRSRDIARARRAMAGMIGGGSAPGPRWDSARVATKIATWRAWTISDRRLEDGRPAVMVLVDTSPSMGPWIDEVLAIGRALSRTGIPGGEVVTVNTANAEPYEVLYPGCRRAEYVYAGVDNPMAWYRDVIARYQVQAVVVVADWDGADIYRQLAEMGIPVYWVDVYGCTKLGREMVVPFAPKWAIATMSDVVNKWSRAARARVKYALGCGNVESMLRALEVMIRRG